jgi:putative PIN family toxin of toxin-antitoxin system
MRVVLDTNILARAASGPPGLADALLRLCMAAPNLLCLSPFLLAELSRALRYPRVRKIHGMSDHEVDQYIGDLQAGSLVVIPPGPLDAVVSSDPDDDPVVATAVAAQSVALCTLDRYLHQQVVIDYCARRGIEVTTDIQLLHRLRTATP